MKIAHVITRLVAGGAQRNTLICAAHQQASGHEVTVIFGPETGSEGSLIATARAGGYRVMVLEHLVRPVHPFYDFCCLIKLVQAFRRERFDLVHTHTSKAGILGRIAARLSAVPIVVHTPHGHVFHSYFSPLKSFLFKSIEIAIAPCSDALVMLTGAELQEHLDVGAAAPGRTVVIPSGVDLSGFNQLVPKAQRFCVGYVGRLVDIKGVIDLLEAFSILARQNPGAELQLLLVGDGPLRAEVVSRVDRMRLAAEVRLVGWQVEIAPYLEQMSVLVVPSHNEAMGRVVVEAMAASLPVIASKVGGLAELVVDGETGLLIKPRAPEEVAAALQTLFEDPVSCRRMGENGRLRSALYSEEVMLRRLGLLYARLARQEGLTRLARGLDSEFADLLR